jgi:two-component system, chemotaxis family, sensor kinase Cph1
MENMEHQAEDPVCQLQARLEQSVREVQSVRADFDTFSYVVAHDLKEPLLGIETYATFLLEDYGARLDDEGRQLVATVLDLAARQRRMIDAIHCYSSVGRATLSLEDTDLNGLLADVVDSLHDELLNFDVEVRIPRPLPSVRCDPSLVRDVWRSLITNAASFNDKPERWVELGSAPSPEAARTVFYVSDNGIGIPAKHRTSIFSLFSRLGRTAGGKPGVGAGLAIAQKRIERHGGTIWVDSTVGEGSTFCFTLEGQRPS